MKICAPFAGIVRFHVDADQKVNTGEVLATIEAVKLEAPVLAPGPGVVGTVHVADFSDVVGGDLLIELSEVPA